MDVFECGKTSVEKYMLVIFFERFSVWMLFVVFFFEGDVAK